MTANPLDLLSTSAEQTEALGFTLAEFVPLGALVALRGELASGKTCFTRGLARRLAPSSRVTSPTFTLVNEYGVDPPLFHADFYRLDTIDDVRALGDEEIFAPERGISVVEWADRAEDLLPDARIDVVFEHVGDDHRRIIIHAGIPLGPRWQDALQDVLT